MVYCFFVDIFLLVFRSKPDTFILYKFNVRITKVHSIRKDEGGYE
jgi:hypothetical protein